MDSRFSKILARVRPGHISVDGIDSVGTFQLAGWYLRKAFLPGMRGVVRSLTFGGSRLPVFIGSGVSIAYPRHLHMGEFSMIGSRSNIMAFSLHGIWLGKRVTIRENAWVQCTSHPANPGEGLWVGNDTYIGPSATLGIGGSVHIGQRCQIGAGVVIVAENHDSEDDGSPSASKVLRKGVSIGDDCWLGHRVTVLDGVTLGRGCVVGAGAVVTKSFPPGSRVAGVPAKVIGPSKPVSQ
jgi:acetyltransferase-like isoleucine patch superfamily enzyme